MSQPHTLSLSRFADPGPASAGKSVAYAFLVSVALVVAVHLAPSAALAATDSADAAEPERSGVAVAVSDSLAPLTEGLPARALRPESETKPLDPELQAVLDRERVELDRLRVRFENAPDHAAALAAQQAIDALKQLTEIELLQIQARRMRERGFEKQAVELEQSVASMIERLPRRSDAPGAPAPASPR